MPGIYPLKGTVKHYDWGGYSFIPSLLQIENKENRPFAEYWLGAHANDDCMIEMDGKEVLLKDYIDEHSTVLGKKIKKRFGQLPFLLKALDVRDMLSIQVHPSKKAAKKEFKRENKAGIPLDASTRNYKDDNHKPELMVAMSDFWLIHGFKPKKEIRNVLKTIPEFNLLSILFEKFGYRGLYKTIMEMPQQEVNNILGPLVNQVIPLYKEGKLDKTQADFWAAKAALKFTHDGNIDRGIFSIYLFNLLQLKTGEGIFQNAGVPHAYLEGQNIEIMASSDNVLRGGLTNKHIDVQELMKHVKCKATKPRLLKGKKEPGEIIYTTPAPDFQLSSLYLKKGRSFSLTAKGPEIILLTAGHATINGENVNIDLKAGTPAAIIFNKEKVQFSALADSVLFKAAVPGSE